VEPAELTGAESEEADLREVVSVAALTELRSVLKQIAEPKAPQSPLLKHGASVASYCIA
jgi:hypothetical protein